MNYFGIGTRALVGTDKALVNGLYVIFISELFLLRDFLVFDLRYYIV